MGMPDMGMMSGQPPMGMGVGAGMPRMPKISPTQQKYIAVVRDLTEAASTLVIKVATCKCDKKDTCKIYQQAQKIADKIEALQEMGRVTEREATKTGKGR